MNLAKSVEVVQREHLKPGDWFLTTAPEREPMGVGLLTDRMDGNYPVYVEFLKAKQNAQRVGPWCQNIFHLGNFVLRIKYPRIDMSANPTFIRHIDPPQMTQAPTDIQGCIGLDVGGRSIVTVNFGASLPLQPVDLQGGKFINPVETPMFLVANWELIADSEEGPEEEVILTFVNGQPA